MKSHINDLVPDELDYQYDVAQEVEAPKKGLLASFSVGLVIFLVYSSFRTSGLRFIGIFMSFYLADIQLLSVSEASLILGSVSLVGVFAAPLGGFFSDKWGYKPWLITALSLSILCIALAYLSPTILFVVIYFGYRFFTFSGNPAQVSIVSRLMPPSHQELGHALSFLPGSIVGSIIPTIAGILADQMGLTILFPIGITIMGITLVLLKFIVKV